MLVIEQKVRETHSEIGSSSDAVLLLFARPRLEKSGDFFPRTRFHQTLDQDLSLGMGGVLHSELAGALAGVPGAPLLTSFVGGLGGRDVSNAEIAALFDAAARAADAGQAPPPRLLFTGAELREVRKLQGVALGERHDLARGEGS